MEHPLSIVHTNSEANAINIHEQIYNKLKYFIDIEKIPNIIFHGPSGSGKRTLVNNFIKMIYKNDKDMIKSYVMYVNCAHGKGIKFIREELKFFAKTHTNNGFFKSIILSNADKLTIDGQSALRRCIELFSHTTRFFIIVEDKYKLLKPILSRFCEIYLSLPIINNVNTNLNKHHIEETYKFIKDKTRENWLKKKLDKSNQLKKLNEYCELSNTLYEKGYCALDLMDYIEKTTMDETRKYQLLLTFNKIKREFRNEKILMLVILNFLFIKPDACLENISFI
jgi:DNA polymerase III delta prime subunit